MGFFQGVLAGAVGTVALNVSTYLDMAVRARPASQLPAKTARELAERAGVDLAEGDPSSNGDDEAAQTRSTALGQLMGYGTGLGVGAVYGLIRRRFDLPSVPLVGVGLGLASTAMSSLPMTALGLTDPRQWPAKAWASDLVPHLAYGMATAAAYEALADR